MYPGAQWRQQQRPYSGGPMAMPQTGWNQMAQPQGTGLGSIGQPMSGGTAQTPGGVPGGGEFKPENWQQMYTMGSGFAAQPTQQPQAPGGGSASGPAWTNDPQFANMDPRLKQVFLESGQTPTGRGSGNTDWQYWQDKMRTGDANYFLGRLSSDFSGGGPDTGRSGGGGIGLGSMPFPVENFSGHMQMPQATSTGSSGSGQGPAPTSAGVDPFAASGGGVYYPNTGQWVPKNNAPAQQAAAAANGGPGQPGGTTGEAPAGGSTTPGQPSTPSAPATSTAGNFSFTPMTAPGDITPQTTTAPDALTLDRLATPSQFQGLTAAELQQDPSYQFRLDQTLGAMQNQAAAKGLLHSTNTVQALGDTAGQMASQEYAAANQRKLDAYNTNLQANLATTQANNAAAAQAYGMTNQFGQAAQQFNAGQNLAAQQFNNQQALAANQQAYQQGLNAYNANLQAELGRGQLGVSQGQLALGNREADINRELGLGNINLGYTRAANDLTLGQGQLALGNRNADISQQLGLGNIGLGYYQAGNAYNLGLGNQQLGWANFGLGADQQQFNQGYSLANMGLQAAGQ